jgi:hypothetical protein
MNIVWLLGRGRSGTTWVARMLAAHIDCLYKHEPFLQGKQSQYRHWLDRVCSDADYSDALQDLVKIFQKPVHDVDYPPFNRRLGWNRSPTIMRALWQLAKVVPKTMPAFQWYGTAEISKVRNVLIKDVNFPNERVPVLWSAIHPRIIALLKNPYASVVSAASFYGGDPRVRPEWIARVREVIRSPGHQQFECFEGKLNQMSFDAFEALRWRIQSEPLAQFVHNRDNCTAITYETCCMDPIASIKALCSVAGWEYATSIQKEILKSTDGKASWRERRRGRYLTRRDPVKAANAWKRHMTPERRREVDSVVGESPLLALWSDLEI